MRAQFHAVEELAFEQFEAAIDIRNPDPQHHAHQHRPRLPVDAPHQWISAMDALARDDIVRGNKRGEACHFLRIELPIAIGEHHVGLRGRADAGDHRAAVAAILWMMHDLDVRVLAREAIRDRAGLVGAAVIDDDHFPVVGNARKLGEETPHHAFHVRFLIVRGQEDTDAWQALSGTHFDDALVGSIAEVAIATAKEHQRLTLARLGFFDLADVDGVIAAIVRSRDLAFEPGDDVVKNRRAIAPRVIRDAGELVAAADGEFPRQLFLVIAQDVDGEDLALLE